MTCLKAGVAILTGAWANLRQIEDVDANMQQKPCCWHKTLAFGQMPSQLGFACRGQE